MTSECPKHHFGGTFVHQGVQKFRLCIFATTVHTRRIQQHTVSNPWIALIWKGDLVQFGIIDGNYECFLAAFQQPTAVGFTDQDVT